jgi:hypothetical protein
MYLRKPDPGLVLSPQVVLTRCGPANGISNCLFPIADLIDLQSESAIGNWQLAMTSTHF